MGEIGVSSPAELNDFDELMTGGMMSLVGEPARDNDGPGVGDGECDDRADAKGA